MKEISKEQFFDMKKNRLLRLQSAYTIMDIFGNMSIHRLYLSTKMDDENVIVDIRLDTNAKMRYSAYLCDAETAKREYATYVEQVELMRKDPSCTYNESDTEIRCETCGIRQESMARMNDAARFSQLYQITVRKMLADKRV